MIIISKYVADSIRGKYGEYSRIEPLEISHEFFIIPNNVMSNEDLKDSWAIIGSSFESISLEQLQMNYPELFSSGEQV